MENIEWTEGGLVEIFRTSKKDNKQLGGVVMPPMNVDITPIWEYIKELENRIEVLEKESK